MRFTAFDTAALAALAAHDSNTLARHFFPMPSTTITWLEPLTLDRAEAAVAHREHLLLLAQRSNDQHAIDQATYRRDFAARQCAQLRRYASHL